YFYGQYKDGVITVKEYFENIWPTTDAWTKKKTIPSPANAVAAGLKLKHSSPIANLRAEVMAIARMEGALMERQAAYENGEGVYVLPDTEANRKAHPDWKKLTESVFKDDLFHPDYAMLHNNMVSFNRVTANPALSTLRTVANFLRSWQLWLPVFHHANITKTQIRDWMLFSGKTKKVALTLNQLAKKLGADTHMSMENPVYRDWVEHGLAYRCSSEVESMNLVARWVDTIEKKLLGNKITNALHTIDLVKKYRTWLFEKHIPQLKFAALTIKQADAESKLGRSLTSEEKFIMVKDIQNLYGEVNEALFGRSGTMTSMLRLLYMAPAYSEGNVRTNYDAAAFWRKKRGGHSRYQIALSFATLAAAAQVGTLLLTGKLKPWPKDKEEFRDMFKIDTGQVDDRGRKIMLDTMTYEADYLTIWGNLGAGALAAAKGESPGGELGEIPAGLAKRHGGMINSLTRATADLVDLISGDSVYDYYGNKVFAIYDPTLKKAWKLALFEAKRIEPIAISAARQTKDKGALFVLAGLLTLRPSLPEAEKAKSERLRNMFELTEDGEKLSRFLTSNSDPVGAIKEYVENIEIVVALFPEEEKPSVRARFKIGMYNNLAKSLKSIAISDRTPEAKLKDIKKVLSTIPAMVKE
ncbi:MAG: hypothetical protein DRO11_09860, partial [Methanobacteriota archaeon]